MPTKKGNQEGNQAKDDKKRNRFEYTIEHDVVLLQSCLQHDPWQLGKNQWNLVAEEMKEQSWNLSKRSIQLHVQLLLDKMKKGELVIKSGQAERCSKRESLLREIESTKIQCEIPIQEPVEDDDLESNLFEDRDADVFEENEVEVVIEVVAENKAATQRSKVAEKKKADEERDLALKRHLDDEAPSPNANRTKRSKLSFDEELVLQKQEHDLSIAQQRFKLENVQAEREFQLETQRLEIEAKKEERLAQEGQRQDQLHSQMQSQMQAQLDMQNNLCQFLAKFLEK